MEPGNLSTAIKDVSAFLAGAVLPASALQGVLALSDQSVFGFWIAVVWIIPAMVLPSVSVGAIALGRVRYGILVPRLWLIPPFLLGAGFMFVLWLVTVWRQPSFIDHLPWPLLPIVSVICNPVAWILSLLCGEILYRLQRSYPPGHCRKCGYDLRATADRCPECGTEVRK